MSSNEQEILKEFLSHRLEDSFSSAIELFKQFVPGLTFEQFSKEVIDPGMERLNNDGLVRLHVDAVSTKLQPPWALVRQFVAANAQASNMLKQDRLTDAVKAAILAQYYLGALGPEIELALRAQRHRAGARKTADVKVGKLRARACQLAQEFKPWKTLADAGERISEMLVNERKALGDQRLIGANPGGTVQDWLWLDLPRAEFTKLFPRAARARARQRARSTSGKNHCAEFGFRSFSDAKPGKNST